MGGVKGSYFDFDFYIILLFLKMFFHLLSPSTSPCPNLFGFKVTLLNLTYIWFCCLSGGNVPMLSFTFSLRLKYSQRLTDEQVTTRVVDHVPKRELRDTFLSWRTFFAAHTGPCQAVRNCSHSPNAVAWRFLTDSVVGVVHVNRQIRVDVVGWLIVGDDAAGDAQEPHHWNQMQINKQ